jgi:hypothetical protein
MARKVGWPADRARHAMAHAIQRVKGPLCSITWVPMRGAAIDAMPQLMPYTARYRPRAPAGAMAATLMARAGARPQLDPLPGGSSLRVIPTGKQSKASREELGGWHVHFRGADDTLATGWIAGCATALALAIGSELAGRLGICEAQRCDRVYVDTSRNSSKRFCSLACQNRTKAAAHRARR